MNFFEHQHKARHKTWLLITYFTLAVVLIVLAVNLAVYVVLSASINKSPSGLDQWINGPYGIWISVATLAIIVIGSLFSIVKLSGGGRAVAKIVGARKIDPNTRELQERKLINVVEEMSIASGTPVPELYVLEDEAINAFVAGYRPTNTVLVVTRGGLDTFSRDELQGVIGHEYSHIFNGDMRINIRLMGILAGILLIGQIGSFLLRSSSRSRGNSKNSGQLVLVGLALFVIGYIGLFFGSLIKAAISRQREFLADASSVQFTRNPDGIAGALWAIKENAHSSLLVNSHAEDISHFCFGDAVGAKFISLLATHPPLDARIKAIDPHFDLKMRLKHKQKQEVPSAKEPATAPPPLSTPGLAAGFAGSAAISGKKVTGAVSGKKVGETIGQVQAEHLDHAGKVRASIPEPLIEATHNQETVRQVIFALIIADMHAGDRQAGLGVMQKAEGQDFMETVDKFSAQILQIKERFRLALTNMAIPALNSLPWEKRAQFLIALEDLIKADNRFTIFEFAILTILREQLAEDAGRDIKEKYFKYADVINEINLMLSVLARAGAASEQEAQNTYEAIIKVFTHGPIAMVDKSECKFSEISAALKKLNLLSHLLKQTLIESFTDCVIRDGKVLPAEAELLQAIAISLDCPMPPLQV